MRYYPQLKSGQFKRVLKTHQDEIAYIILYDLDSILFMLVYMIVFEL